MVDFLRRVDACAFRHAAGVDWLELGGMVKKTVPNFHSRYKA